MAKPPPPNLNSPVADHVIKWMSRANTMAYKFSGTRGES
jgi:hypothetical protein